MIRETQRPAIALLSAVNYLVYLDLGGGNTSSGALPMRNLDFK